MSATLRVANWYWTSGFADGPGIPRNPPIRCRAGDNLLINYTLAAGATLVAPTSMTLTASIATDENANPIASFVDANFTKTSTTFSLAIGSTITQDLTPGKYLVVANDTTTTSGGAISVGYIEVYGNPPVSGSLSPPSGITPVARGGTGADLSATGPGILCQSTSGAAFTLAELLGLTFSSGTLTARSLYDSNGHVAVNGNGRQLLNSDASLNSDWDVDGNVYFHTHGDLYVDGDTRGGNYYGHDLYSSSGGVNVLTWGNDYFVPLVPVYFESAVYLDGTSPFYAEGNPIYLADTNWSLGWITTPQFTTPHLGNALKIATGGGSSPDGFAVGPTEGSATWEVDNFAGQVWINGPLKFGPNYGAYIQSDNDGGVNLVDQGGNVMLWNRWDYSGLFLNGGSLSLNNGGGSGGGNLLLDGGAVFGMNTSYPFFDGNAGVLISSIAVPSNAIGLDYAQDANGNYEVRFNYINSAWYTGAALSMGGNPINLNNGSGSGGSYILMDGGGLVGGKMYDSALNQLLDFSSYGVLAVSAEIDFLGGDGQTYLNNSGIAIPSLAAIDSGGNQNVVISGAAVSVAFNQSHTTTLVAANPSANRTVTLPNATGTVALVSGNLGGPTMSGLTLSGGSPVGTITMSGTDLYFKAGDASHNLTFYFQRGDGTQYAELGYNGFKSQGISDYNTAFYLMGAAYGNALQMSSSFVVKWSNTGAGYTGWDVGLARNAAGVVEVNNGTAGTYRDLLARTIIANPTSFAGLPTGTKGMRAYITDCNTTTFHATAAGGGSNNVSVVHDGTNWKVGG